MEPIAIVGMAALLPHAPTLEAYWHNLVTGVDAIIEVPQHRLDPEFFDPGQAHRPDRFYCNRGGFVDEFATFSPLKFGVMPSSIPFIEPDQLIALEIAAATIADAGGADRLPDGDRVGVIIGRGGSPSPGQTNYGQRVRLPTQIALMLRELLPDIDQPRIDQVLKLIDERLGPHQPESTIGLVPNLTASRVANRFNLRGPAYTVDAACASSLIAVDQAIAELNSGRLDAVLAGGVHHVHDVTFWSVFCQLGALSRRGEIRPFDTAADGLLIGEGSGLVLLKRFADAARDGDRIYAVIRGTGVSSDGRSASMFNPASAGQSLAIRRAWQAAGLDPTARDALGLLEAHGTGTPTGDAAELATVLEVFGPANGAPRPVIGSVKSMIGHTMPAAGIAGLIKAALAISKGMLLPTLHCDNPRSELERTRFAPIATAMPWESDGPRRAGVNAFGFGGINAHLILEEPPAAAWVWEGVVSVEEPEQVLCLAGASLEELSTLLDHCPHETHRPHEVGKGPCRLGIVGPTEERIALARKALALGRPWRGGRDIWFSPNPLLGGTSPGKIAFVYPGIEAEFGPRVDDVVAHFGFANREWSMQDLARHGNGVVELGRLLHMALLRMGVRPDTVAGHSLGEWAAAFTTGQLSTVSADEFLKVFDSGSIEVPGYVFAYLGAGVEQVQSRLTRYPSVVISHDNAPAQCAVNGPEDKVDQLINEMRRDGTICQKLPFQSAFHTPAFIAGLEAIGVAVKQWRLSEPSMPVWSATLAAPYPADLEEAADVFVRHMIEPVRFRSTITAMHDAGVRVFLQVGFGQLSSVISENLRDLDHLAMPVNVSHRSGLAQLRRVATALWAEGANPDLTALEHRPTRLVTTPPGVAAGPEVRLDLGGRLVRLGPAANGLLGQTPTATPLPVTVTTPSRAPARAPAPPPPAAAAAPARAAAPAAAAAPARATAPAAAPTPRAASPDTLAVLERLGAGSSAAAELALLLRETTRSTVSTVDNASQPGVPVPKAKRPADVYRETLVVSLETMPYLWDHCFFAQPADWPHPADRWPVVPATTVVHHMMEAVERAAPGMRAIKVRDARFHRWVIAAPPQQVEILVQPNGAGSFSVSFGTFANATIEVASAYPAATEPTFAFDPATERPPTVGPEQLYGDRLMFHGPLFHGVTEVHALGDLHVRGQVTAPTPPGASLDNALQLFGDWIISTQPARAVALPVRFGEIRFYGPPPTPGTTFTCPVRVRSIEDSQIVADTQLIKSDGRIWAVIEGAVERRFDSNPTARLAERWPHRYSMSQRQPEGWVLAFDCWTDPLTLSMAAQAILGGSRYLEFEREPAAARKQWLLGRIAAKDAVRFKLWDAGHTEIYPIELTVHGSADSLPRVEPRPGRGWLEYRVSLAHCAEVAVAIAGLPAAGDIAGRPGVGIDVAPIVASPERTVLSPLESMLLESLPGSAAERLARVSTGKKAALRAHAADVAATLVSATAQELTIAVGDDRYRIKHRFIDSPDNLPPRQYVVSWTQ